MLLQSSRLVCPSPRGCCCCLGPPVQVAACSIRHVKGPRVELPQELVRFNYDKSDTGSELEREELPWEDEGRASPLPPHYSL